MFANGMGVMTRFTHAETPPGFGMLLVGEPHPRMKLVENRKSNTNAKCPCAPACAHAAI